MLDFLTFSIAAITLGLLAFTSALLSDDAFLAWIFSHLEQGGAGRLPHCDRNLCQDTCFLSGSYKQDFTNQKSKISGRYEAFKGCKNKHEYT